MTTAQRVSQINTTYAEQAAAIQGQLADIGDTVAESYVQAETSASIPFGVFVQKASLEADGSLAQAKLLSAVNNALAGVVIHSHAYDPVEDLDTTGLVPKTILSVLTKGRIWVPVEEAVTYSDPVYTRAVVAGSEVAGAFRKSTDASDMIRILGARWLRYEASLGLALLEFDLTAHIAAAI